MEFLSVFRIKQLANCKGYIAEGAGTVKGRSFVTLRDPKGKAILTGANAGDFSLSAAERLLDELPDRSAQAPKKGRKGS